MTDPQTGANGLGEAYVRALVGAGLVIRTRIAAKVRHR